MGLMSTRRSSGGMHPLSRKYLHSLEICLLSCFLQVWSSSRRGVQLRASFLNICRAKVDITENVGGLFSDLEVVKKVSARIYLDFSSCKILSKLTFLSISAKTIFSIYYLLV
jgi:hypothetical protein